MARDYVAIAAQYQADVVVGIIPACKWVRLACERNRRDLDRQETAAFRYRFDPEAGRRICQMAEMLPHVKGPKAFIVGRDAQGRPRWNTIVLEPWQCWLLTTLFGWKHAAGSLDPNDQSREGLRRFRISLALIPRKNAKSTIAAIVVLYMLVADGESGAECYSAATTRDQAKAIAEIAWEMAKRSHAFRAHFGVRMGSETTKSLSVPATGSKFAPLSADAHTLDSLNVSFAAIDELHAHKTAGVWNVLDTATGARLQPLIFAITTAGIDIGGVCHQKLGYLEKVLDGVFVDEAFFGINYTIDKDDDIRDPRVQRKANPNYGVSVNPDDLMRKVQAALHSSSELNDKLTKHFNVWIRTESSWMTGSQWQTCAKSEWSDFPAAERAAAALDAWKSFPCWIGVDLAEVRDIAALVALFKLSQDTYGAIGRFYLPKKTIDKSPIAQISGWVRDGFILETDGDQADFGRIQADIVSWCDELPHVKEIDFDRALAAQMQQELKKVLEPRMGRDAVDKFVVTVPQRVEEMDPAMKMTERLVLAKQLQHDGNPAMAWMISNVVVERNYKDEIYPRKAGGKDSPNKIDGPVAMWTALTRAMQAEAREPQYQMLIVGGGR
jgi:phage terminase large subunit-like protein